MCYFWIPYVRKNTIYLTSAASIKAGGKTVYSNTVVATKTKNVRGKLFIRR